LVAILADPVVEYNSKLSGRSVKPNPAASCPRQTLAPIFFVREGIAGNHDNEEAPKPWFTYKASKFVASVGFAYSK
jgi:hypothetical protein